MILYMLHLKYTFKEGAMIDLNTKIKQVRKFTCSIYFSKFLLLFLYRLQFIALGRKISLKFHRVLPYALIIDDARHRLALVNFQFIWFQWKPLSLFDFFYIFLFRFKLTRVSFECLKSQFNFLRGPPRSA